MERVSPEKRIKAYNEGWDDGVYAMKEELLEEIEEIENRTRSISFHEWFELKKWVKNYKRLE